MTRCSSGFGSGLCRRTPSRHRRKSATRLEQCSSPASELLRRLSPCFHLSRQRCWKTIRSVKSYCTMVYWFQPEALWGIPQLAGAAGLVDQVLAHSKAISLWTSQTIQPMPKICQTSGLSVQQARTTPLSVSRNSTCAKGE